MAISSTSINDIEQQIASVTAQLEQARAQQFAAAEKAYLTTQKSADLARAKVNELIAKASNTVAAQNRLLTAQANAKELDIELAAALEVYEALKDQKKASEKFAKKVGKVLAGKKLGKKIKLTRAEKDVLKEEKKIAKKNAKKVKKSEKNSVTEAKPVAEETRPAAKKAEVKKSPVKDVTAKKVVAKKAPAKKSAPIAKEDVAPATGDAATLQEVDVSQPVETSIEAVTSIDSNVEAIVDAESTTANPAVENSPRNENA